MTQSVEAAPRHSRIRTQRGPSAVLTVPARKDYVVIIRSAVAQLAACAGFTTREISDLRLAVNEACALLVTGQQSTGVIECRADVGAALNDAPGDVLRVTLAAPTGAFDTPDTDGLGWTMMTALVDAVAWAQDGVTARVDLKVRRGVRTG
ncbi:putative anti-sigma regulatory factor, serine/threonine protein kinase [Catenulispora acidiphila DSM 44928]|uniref:Putative anti-sigma regulatory factor, serine/threonine protein kinase n=1 Tax=Catenulispora acidiphila (strain DSM 44928 / JCM 14897 / NBRC 102108 / NRRL B-24433 / ID139908) TaxID=479433 RepID=C7Q7P4_CATAD|nr:ATP-binding protein [Catenulispora acidiphila]ACU72237.1 putative anti-sigma regulatory factor, serine/threonine protein kinase [Catenulispora acidiphila DSM 44928]